jgi:hypothetical protein
MFGHVDCGALWRSAVSDTDSGTANPERYESLIHLRFWKVQSRRPSRLSLNKQKNKNGKKYIIHIHHQSADRVHIIQLTVIIGGISCRGNKLQQIERPRIAKTWSSTAYCDARYVFAKLTLSSLSSLPVAVWSQRGSQPNGL